MRNDPIFKLQEQMRNDPIFKLQEQMRNDPIFKLQEQMRNDPIFKLQERMRNDPIFKLQEQMRNDPIFKLQEQMRNDPIFKLQEQMRASDPFLKLREEMRRGDLLQKSQEIMSLQFATAFAFVAEQESIIDLSLADDGNPTSIDPFRKFYLFVQNLYDVVREQIQSARSVSELFKIHNLITIIISAAALYYAMQSANTEDVDKLRSSVDIQTDVIREEAAASRLQMQETISALARSVQQMTATRATELGHAIPYRAKRSVPIKAAKAMKAETVGAAAAGQVVFVVAYEKKWVCIETHDLITGENISGWVVKKNLKRLK